MQNGVNPTGSPTGTPAGAPTADPSGQEGSGGAVLPLTRRLGAALDPADGRETPALVLALDADGRTRLRGRRRSVCGRELLLQLPRGEALAPGEWLAGDDGGPAVRVEAAPEPLLEARATDPLDLLRAAYHLGNRHVALEIRPDRLRLQEDPVLADLLRGRGLEVRRCREPFLPEGGAYGSTLHHAAHQGHHQGHHHGHQHAHPPASP